MIETFAPSATVRTSGFVAGGIGWYRKRFKLPEIRDERVAWIEFDGVYRNCDIWLIGQYLVNHRSGYTSFQVNVTDAALWGEENILIVRVDASELERMCGSARQGGSMKKIRWGVIGAGGIAHRRTLPVFSQVTNSELVIIMDVVGADELGQLYNVEATDSAEAILSRDDVDAVYIATPVQFHTEQVIKAARAGKHVLCEKPLARTLAEARAAAQACLEAGVLLQPAYMLRHHGAHKEMLRVIKAGEIGRPAYANMQWSFNYRPIAGAWRQIPELGGGGSLADVGCHMFDLLEMMLGPIARVACRTNTLIQDYPVEDVASVLIEFASGVQATMVASFAFPTPIMPTQLHIYGSAGAVHARRTLTQGSDGDVSIALACDETGAERPLPYVEVNPYAGQIENLAERVLQGEKPTLASMTEALRSSAILDACYESAHTGEFVEVAL